MQCIHCESIIKKYNSPCETCFKYRQENYVEAKKYYVKQRDQSFTSNKYEYWLCKLLFNETYKND